tara:strand:- start:840 stop:1256 length:417 start_codon:yes stop_codon:yes gene_type:complete
MINGIKPKVSKPVEEKSYLDSLQTTGFSETNGLSFDEAMDNLLVKIQENYDEWYSRTDYESKKMNLSLKPGRKFIKVVHDNSVWGFVAKVDGVHKGVPMLKGDILKAATWSQPAKHSRGSIFDSEMHKSFSWTGPNYL